MRKPATLISAIAAFAMGGLLSAFALLPEHFTNDDAAPHPVWREARWPFPMDQWGKGTAYRCSAAACGSEINIYLRAKVGFCDCAKGMTDDADLDRVSDFDLFGGALYPQAAGQAIGVAWMKGRVRPFAIRDGGQADATMISVGLHDHCDALVVTAVLPRGHLSAAEPAVRDFLNSRTMADWAETALGL